MSTLLHTEHTTPLTLSIAFPSNANLFFGFPAGTLYLVNHSTVAWVEGKHTSESLLSSDINQLTAKNPGISLSISGTSTEGG